MPELIRCPECAGQLRVQDEMLGKKVRCPKCKKVFVAQVEEEDVLEEVVDDEEESIQTRPSRRSRRDEDEDEDRPRKRRRDDEDENEDGITTRTSKRRSDEDEEEDRPSSRRWRDEDDEDEDDRPRKRRRRDEEDEDEDEEDRPRKRRALEDDEKDDQPRRRKRGSGGDWHTVYHGLFLILNAIRILVMGFLCYCVLSFVTCGVGAILLFPLYWILVLVCTGMTMFGMYRCISAPNRNGARGLAIASLSMMGAGGFLIPILGLFLPSLAPLSALMSLGAAIVFLLFLRVVCLLRGQQRLASTTFYLIGTLGLCLVFWTVALVVALMGVGLKARGFAVDDTAVTFVAALFMLNYGMALAVAIWYVFYIGWVRDALERYLFPG